MLAALVASVVAEGAKLAPLVFVQVIALLPDVLQSPLISEAVGVVPSRKIPVPALVEFRPPYARAMAVAFQVPPVIVPIAERGKSALVKLVAPNDEPLPVPMTSWAGCPAAAPSVNVEPEIVQVSQFAPVTEQDNTVPPPPPVCWVHVFPAPQIYSCSVLVASVAMNGSPTVHVAGSWAVRPRGKFSVTRFPHEFDNQHS